MVENVEVEALGGGRLRLKYSPGVVLGLAAGDVIEADQGLPSGFKLLERGGNVCVWVFFERKDQNRGPTADRLQQAIEAIGGKLDGGGVFLLVFTVPVSAGLAEIANVLDRCVSAIPGASWMFGNVYDPGDGKTPLNWWPKESGF